jgi:hypothetical protein
MTQETDDWDFVKLNQDVQKYRDAAKLAGKELLQETAETNRQLDVHATVEASVAAVEPVWVVKTDKSGS